MTDLQILTIVLAIVLPLTGVIYASSRVGDMSKALGGRIDDTNRRIDDLNTSLSRRIDDTRDSLRVEIRGEAATLRAEMEVLREHIDAGFTRLEAALKAHELEHHK